MNLQTQIQESKTNLLC